MSMMVIFFNQSINEFYEYLDENNELKSNLIIVVTIGEFSELEKLLEYSISYIVRENELIDVAPDGYSEVDGHSVLVRNNTGSGRILFDKLHIREIDQSILLDFRKKLDSTNSYYYTPVYFVFKREEQKVKKEGSYGDLSVKTKFRRKEINVNHFDSVKTETLKRKEFNRNFD